MATKKHLKLADGVTPGVEVVAVAKPFKIKKSVFHANEDGTCETKVITITYYPDSGSFETPLPAYMARENNLLSGETALSVTSHYEAVCEDYSRRRLTMAGPRLLWVGVRARSADFEQNVFGISVLLGLGMHTVIRYKDGKYGESIICVDADDKPFGEPMPVSMANPVLIVNTDANRAKVQTLIDSIKQAAAVLAQIHEVADPEAYIQSINDRWQHPAAAVAGPAASDDDEEL